MFIDPVVSTENDSMFVEIILIQSFRHNDILADKLWDILGSNLTAIAYFPVALIVIRY